MAHIEDFGQKIGGARKDLWKLNGITASDFADMNDMERSTYVKKDNIWIKPDWEKKIADGTPQAVAYWQNKMRQAIPPRPEKATKEAQQNYISVVSQIRDSVMAVKSQYDIQGFYKNVLSPLFLESTGMRYYVSVRPEADGVINNKVLKAAQASYSKMEREAKEKLFGIPKEDKVYVSAKQDLEIYCYDKNTVTLDKDTYDSSATRVTINHGFGRSFFYLRERDKFYDINSWKENTYFVMGKNRKPLSINLPTREAAEQFVESYARAAQIAASIETDSKDKTVEDSNRKKNFVPPQLADVQYTGKNYRGIQAANGQMFLDDLKFRAGEFGNWLNNADRQTSMNMAYDALRNLAYILKVPPEDVSLNGSLAIAFGARGRGGAGAGAAHYEPLRQVINLTKMSGAGCLAHEWGHALDHAIGIAAGAQGFATEAKRPATGKLPDSFVHLMSSLKYKEVEVSVEDRKKEVEPKIKNARRNLKNWIDSAKPRNLPEDLSKTWDAITTRILDNPQTFHGTEYNTMFGRDGVLTHPDVEQLSQISKFATNHVIPRSTKEQFALWAKEINRINKVTLELTVSKSRVPTDFYKGSQEFDKIYSKYGHGYWSSDCEMFARAFDCYIADKVKEGGYRSDYLSSNADSFSFPKDGSVVAAFPRGEERKIINQVFDLLFQELKECQLLHEAPEVDVIPKKESKALPERQSAPEEPKNVRYEQLSLDELLFSAASKVPQGTTGRHGNLSDRSR